MGPSSGNIHPISRRELQILPKAYDKSERLDLAFWDPRRLAAHVLATLSPADHREKAADLILERQITGSFLARYTLQIEELLDGEGDCELIRAIAHTVSKTFWVPLHEPRAFDRYDTLSEITKDLRHSTSCVEVGMATVARSAAASWVFEAEEEAVNVPLHKLVEEGAGITDDAIGIKEHQVDGNAGCGRSRELGGGRSSTGDGDRDGINNLRTLWEVSLTGRPAFRYSAPGMFWNYTTLIFGLSRRG